MNTWTCVEKDSYHTQHSQGSTFWSGVSDMTLLCSGHADLPPRVCSAQNGAAELAARQWRARLKSRGWFWKRALSCAPVVEQSWDSSYGTGSSSKAALVTAGSHQAPLAPRAGGFLHTQSTVLTAGLFIPGEQKDSSNLYFQHTPSTGAHCWPVYSRGCEQCRKTA